MSSRGQVESEWPCKAHGPASSLAKRGGGAVAVTATVEVRGLIVSSPKANPKVTQKLTKR
eukprot:7500942-Lingulodinium_polyedra.AAC.1